MPTINKETQDIHTYLNNSPILLVYKTSLE